MRSSVNLVFVGGSVVSAPVVHTLSGNVKVCTFVLMSGLGTDIEYHRVVVREEALNELAEGDLQLGVGLVIEGRLATRKWTPQSSVRSQTITEVVAARVSLEPGLAVQAVTHSGVVSGPAHPLDEAQAQPSTAVDEIPF